MRMRALIPAALLLLWLLPLPAAAQDWSVQADIPAGMRVRTKGPSNKVDNFSPDSVGGIFLSVGTPYHVGFALEHVDGHFNLAPGFDRDIMVDSADVFLDVPVPFSDWFAASVGTGWGQGRFSPNTTVEQSGSSPSTIETVNLWQFFLSLGFKITGGLEARLGYHEYNGKLTFRNQDPNNPHSDTNPVKIQVTTLGVRYTF